MKEKIKHLIGYIRLCLFHIRAPQKKGIYLGKNLNVVGGKNIKVEPYVCIRPGCDLWASGKIKIGLGTEIGKNCRISIKNELIIGRDVLFSPNVYITDCDHEYRDINRPVMKQGVVAQNNTIEIGDGSFIGINSVLVGNIRIGKHCIIGANAVVTTDIEDYCVATGVPARVIKTYNRENCKWEIVKN